MMVCFAKFPLNKSRLICLLLVATCSSPLSAREPIDQHGTNSAHYNPFASQPPRRHRHTTSLSPNDQVDPGVSWAVHNQGNIQLTVSNAGHFGSHPRDNPLVDPFTGDRIIYCIYPRNSDIVYLLTAALAIGGIVDEDTLVSLWDFLPDIKPFGEIKYQSIDVTRDYFSEEAHSEHDIICEYYDTITLPDLVSSDHRPLDLKVRQRSMAWSGASLGDFILFHFDVETMGSKRIEDVFIGFSFGGGIVHQSRWGTAGYSSPISGFLKSWPAPEGCGFVDPVEVAYFMESNGDPVEGQFDYRSPLAALGIRVLSTPLDTISLNYNWLTYIPSYRGGKWWHPQRRPKPGEKLRDLVGSGVGYPLTDKNMYYVMSHPEFDYDQITTAIDKSLSGWLPPPPEADKVASGRGASSHLSFGPFELGPGKILPFTIAVVAGDSVHHDPTAHERLFRPLNPWPFYNQLDFSSLAENARWAKWVYDNPGYDTDGDGYLGEFRLCDSDTFWHEGDGVPDFRADVPPPAPEVRIMTATNRLVIRWNGYYSETNIDQFTRVKDFEGYRVYVGLDSRRSSLSLLSSYDHENYNRYTLVFIPPDRYRWSCRELPFTLDSLKILYDNPNFDPLFHPRENPLHYNDTLYYFTKQDFNVSHLLDSAEIHKAYPEAPDPGLDTSLWTEDDLTYEHDKPLPKFYEYEYVYDNLLPTVTYYIGVTAFDFGFATGNIPAKESNLLNNLILAYAQTSADSVEEYQLDAYVYPNPYLYDAHYHRQGFENRDRRQIPARSRRIHFANLPRVCKISIYSLDGDLIRELDHYCPEGGPEAMHDSWDLITRNTQAVVAGLYYFVIESEHRTQIGKFVIIM